MNTMIPTLLVYLTLSALPHPSAQTTLQFDKTIFVDDRLRIESSSSDPIAPPFPYHVQSFLPSKRTGTVVALGDLNGDGTLDVLTDHELDDGRHIEAWMNNGITGSTDGLTFSPAVDLPIHGPAVFAVGDMNGDGLADLIVGRKYMRNQVHINNNRQGSSGGSSSDGSDYLVVDFPEIAGTAASETKSITVADIDGDGDLDIIVRDSQRNRILINSDGAGENYSVLPLPNPRGGNKFVTAHANNIAVADMDGDGDLEVLFVDMGPEKNTVMKNVGGGNYDVVELPGSAVARSIAVGDVNGDGHLDIVTGLEPVLLLNKGNGVDYDVIQLPGLREVRGAGVSDEIELINEIALEDLNGDGLLDIIYCTMDGPFVLIHRGDGGFDVYTIPSLGDYGFISMAFGDIDNDGVLDLAMAHSKLNHSHMLLLSGEDVIDNSAAGGKLSIKLPNRSTLSTETILDYIVFFLVGLLVLALLCMCCNRCRRRKDDGQANSSVGSSMLRTAKGKIANKFKQSDEKEAEMVRLSTMRVI